MSEILDGLDGVNRMIDEAWHFVDDGDTLSALSMLEDAKVAMRRLKERAEVGGD